MMSLIWTVLAGSASLFLGSITVGAGLYAGVKLGARLFGPLRIVTHGDWGGVAPMTDIGQKAAPECWCFRCSQEWDEANPPENPFDALSWRFIVCSICGNKRCPHATDHRLACTNSNEPGQRGSRYE